MTGRRRANGEGSVYRRPDGRWAGMLDLGWANGKRSRRTVYGRTRAEVIAKLRELRRAQESGVNLTAPPRTLTAWLQEWMTDVKATDGTRPSTLDRYRQVVECHLIPGLGTIMLDKLSAREVQRFLVGLASARSAGTVAKVHAVLRAALSDAVRFDLVARNVAKSVRVPSATADERRVPTPEEISHFFEVIEGDRLADVFILAVAIGLRRGELLGLRWADVDLDKRVLVVRTTIQRSGGELREAAPKTRRSARRIHLPQMAARALERQRVRQARERLAAGPAWQDEGWIFASTIGTPIEPRNLTRRFTELRKLAGLDWLHLHDLRHACGTYLIAHGVDLRTVMEVLGHSTVRLTMDTYAHVLDRQLSDAAAAMDRALGGE